MSSQRIAAAPISWGVCEVPGWGYQLPKEQVLSEMHQLGITATELGPLGFLPDDPDERAEQLSGYQLSAIGGFVPLILHDPDADPLRDAELALRRLSGGPGQVMVVAAVSGVEGYDQSLRLDAGQWKILLENLEGVRQLAARASVTMSLHPHVGTLVEGPDEVRRVLQESSVPLTLDTGHLLIGGSDPLALAVESPQRVAHVHLKDVDATLAGEVRSGGSYTEAVSRGMYRPLGRGDVDIAGIVAALEGSGYRGWYVMEQDTILASAPQAGFGPSGDVEASLAYLEDKLA